MHLQISLDWVKCVGFFFFTPQRHQIRFLFSFFHLAAYSSSNRKGQHSQFPPLARRRRKERVGGPGRSRRRRQTGKGMKGEKKWREIGRNGKMNSEKCVCFWLQTGCLVFFGGGGGWVPAVVLPHIGDLRFTPAPCKVTNVLPLLIGWIAPLTALYPVKNLLPSASPLWYVTHFIIIPKINKLKLNIKTTFPKTPQCQVVSWQQSVPLIIYSTSFTSSPSLFPPGGGMFFFFLFCFSRSARWLPRTALVNAPLGFAAGKDLAAAASLLPRRDDRFVTATWKIQGGVSARRVKRPSPPPPPLIYPHDKWRNRPLRATRSVRFQRLKSSLIGPASERFQLAVAVLTEVGGSPTLNIEQRMTFLNGGYASALFARCLQALLPEGYVGQIQRAEGTFHLPGLLKDALSVISQYRCGS